MPDRTDIADRLAEAREQALRHTEQSLDHMARYGIRPEGQVGLFLPPEARQQSIHRLPYEHDARQVVTIGAAIAPAMATGRWCRLLLCTTSTASRPRTRSIIRPR